ncbi:uncharacterized protein [Musca autumnalis]|uniref:uncharacterized protein n=1 Tax=Musca autumnalis TaxID=221902 RepID=UPI003CF38739
MTSSPSWSTHSSSIRRLSLTTNNNNSVAYICAVWCCCAILFTSLTDLVLCNNVNDGDGENISSTTSTKYANESASNLNGSDLLLEDSYDMVWSQVLEDYVFSQSPRSRASKDLPYFNEMNGFGGSPSPPYQMMMNPGMGPNPPHPQMPLNYHSSAYKRPNSNVYINKRIGEAGVELEPHKRAPLQVVNPQFRPMTNQMIQQQQHQQPGFLQQLFGTTGPSASMQLPQTGSTQQHRPLPLQQHNVRGGPPQTFRAVSENDLYLLGAIEKLVYRVDYLESRVRRTEQLIYYLMAGNKQQEVRDPCPTNFTRISDNCYYINSYQQVNWKTANSACKALNAHLAEFEKVSENEEIMAYLLNQPNHRGRDYWLGGLNPGLIWIWSNSAKPVNPNMNLTSIAMSHKEGSSTTKDTETESNTIDVGGEKDDKGDNSKNESILNNTLEIPGEGRCLRLAYNSAKHAYNYHGQECTTRQSYICEHEDKTLDNKLKKIARDLKLFD